MVHVHHPARLVVLARCATLSGTVRSAGLEVAYDDLKIVIVPDRGDSRYLRPENHGAFVADVIATDLLQVPRPPVGSHVTVSGAWVLNRAKRTVELHPTYRIDVHQAQPSPQSYGRSRERHGPPPARRLDLTVQAPSTVSLGNPVVAFVRASWLQQGSRRRASEIRLFAEVTDASGTGVRWKGALTNSLGVAALHLLALQVPGTYTLTVYATPSGQGVTAAARLMVTRR